MSAGGYVSAIGLETPDTQPDTTCTNYVEHTRACVLVLPTLSTSPIIPAPPFIYLSCNFVVVLFGDMVKPVILQVFPPLT